MTKLENLIDEYKGSKNIKKRFNQQKCNRKKFSSLELTFIILLAGILIYVCQVVHEKGLFGEKKQFSLGNLLNFKL